MEDPNTEDPTDFVAKVRDLEAELARSNESVTRLEAQRDEQSRTLSQFISQPQKGPSTPPPLPKPGPMPDPIEQPREFAEWNIKRDEYRDAQFEQRLSAQRDEFQQTRQMEAATRAADNLYQSFSNKYPHLAGHPDSAAAAYKEIVGDRQITRAEEASVMEQVANKMVESAKSMIPTEAPVNRSETLSPGSHQTPHYSSIPQADDKTAFEEMEKQFYDFKRTLE